MRTHISQSIRSILRLPSLKPDAAALILLSLLTLFFMWRVVFLGKVLLPLDVVFTMEPWKSEAPAIAAPVWNPIITDAVWASFPMASAARELHQGGSFFWDPYSMAGMPSVATGELFSHPLFLLFSPFVSVAKAMSWAAVLSLLLGSSFMYLLLRELDCGPWASLIGSLTFTFNGYLVDWLSLPLMTGSMIWLPAIAWGIERSLRRRDYRWSLVSAFAFAMQIFSANLLVVLYAAITMAIFLCWRAVVLACAEHKLSAGLRPLVCGAITFGTGSGFAAVPLFLTVQLIFHTDRTSQAGARSALDYTSHLIRLLAPDLYGTSLYGDSFRTAFNYVETNLYFGILPLFFIVAAVFANRRLLTWPLFALGMAALLAVYNFSPFRQLIAWIYPVFLNSFPGRIFYVVVFCWSLLVGLGADWLAKHNPRRLLNGLGIGAFVLAVILLGLAGAATSIRTPPQLEAFVPLFYRLQSFSIGSLLVAAGFLGATATIFWLWAHRNRPSKYLRGTVLVCVITDLFVAGMNFNPAFDESLAFPDTPSVKVLQALQAGHVGTVRMASVPSFRILYGMTPELYGLQSVSGYTSWALKRYARYIHLTQPVTTINHIFLTECCSPLLDALNAKYVYTPAGVELQDADKLRVIYDGPVKIYENTAALPRAWVVHRIVSAPPGNLDVVADRLLAPGFAPATEAVVETDWTYPESHELSAQRSRAEIVRYEPEAVVVEAELSQDGLLILSDAMYPGWRAYVDDQPAPIYYTNLFMRGVFLRSGSHRVRFVYRSDTFLVAVAVSMATILLVIGTVVFPRGRARWREVSGSGPRRSAAVSSSAAST